MIQLVLATVDDVPLLKMWDQQEHVLRARNLTEPDDEWIWEVELRRQLGWRELLIGMVNKRPIAFIQILDPLLEETHYWGETTPNKLAIDIWIGSPEDLGKGYGTILMQQVLNRCFTNSKIERVIIDPLVSNTNAIRFYERLGFRLIEQRKFGEDDCYVYAIDRKEWLNKKHP
jgi:aminoglycoside 6'-N-acetyltransferase